jgi:hypothetical protein
MEKILERLVNHIERENIKLMFGEGSKIQIDSIGYSTNTKKFVIHTKVLATEIDDSIDVFPTGVNIIIEESWKLFAISGGIDIISSLDLR